MENDVTGRGRYFDGRSPKRYMVTFAYGTGRLTLRSEAGTECAVWPRQEIRLAPARAGMLRLAMNGSDARLEIAETDEADLLAAALQADGGRVATLGALSGRTKARLAGGTALALVSLGLFVWFGLPAIVQRLVPLIPVETEMRLGQAVNDRILTVLGGKERRMCDGAEGRKALTQLAVRMNTAAETGFSVDISVLDLSVPNAVALPGGRIVVFRGLLDKVTSGEQLAAVLAHEYGHVAHRDGMKVLSEAAGLGLVFSLVTGDFTGQGITIVGLRAVMQARYTREVETEADLYAIDLMSRLGTDPSHLARALETITAGIPAAQEDSFLSSHPATPERVAMLRQRIAERSAVPQSSPLLVSEEWTAIKAICSR